MNRIYYVRHGENRANLTKEFSHHKIDYPLTLKGVLQARQTAEYLLGKGVEVLYSSPLLRAQETAEIIAGRLGRPYTVLENFREVNTGDLENHPPTAEAWAYHDRIFAAWYDGHPETAFQGGENYFQVWERLRFGLLQVLAAHPGQTLLIVAHGGLLHYTLHELCDLERTWTQGRLSENCSITELELEIHDGVLRGNLLRWAGVEHIHGEAAEFVSAVPTKDTKFV
jgi:probable phosphoglycerate mutase